MKRGILVKKKEFLRDLKKELIGIDEEDKEDIIAEYNDCLVNYLYTYWKL